MADVIDFTDIPYLQEILDFLPIEPYDNEDIVNYINNISNLIFVNYKYEQYQFSYFGVHLLYMTYIYSTVWKISQIEPQRYSDAIIFARPYSGKEQDFKIDDPQSIFAYSVMPEKEIVKILNIIGLDKPQIGKVCELVNVRNEMAHASGKFDILNEDAFDSKVHNIYISMKNIHRGMENTIKNWYKNILLKYCKNEFENYDNPKDIIIEQMIQSFKLSVNELLICKEASINDLISSNFEFKDKLKEFKRVISEYCQEMGYIL